MVSIDDLFII